MPNVIKKYKITQLQQDDTLLELHPATDADIVSVETGTGKYQGSATNVQDALEEVYDMAATGGVTGVKGNKETTYRTGNVNLTPANIGAEAAFTDGSAVIASVASDIVTIKGGVKQSAGAILNKTTTEAADIVLAKVAKTGVYDDLSGKPSLGTAASKDVGTSSGNVPVLDSNGKLASSVIPAVAITDTFTASSQAAMLALTAQKGDICIRTDVSKTFILTADGASTLANWKELATPTDAVTSVNGKTGAVTLTYTDVEAAAANHNHTGVYQPLDSDLTAIAALTGQGLLERSSNGDWSLSTGYVHVTSTSGTTESKIVNSASNGIEIKQINTSQTVSEVSSIKLNNTGATGLLAEVSTDYTGDEITNFQLKVNRGNKFMPSVGSGRTQLTVLDTVNGDGSGDTTSIYLDEAITKLNQMTLVGSAGSYTGVSVAQATTAGTAGSFTSAKTIALTGDITGSASGGTSAGGWSIATTLKNSGVTAGTYSALTVNAKGIVTAGAQMIEVGTQGQTTPSASLAVGGLFFQQI